MVRWVHMFLPACAMRLDCCRGATPLRGESLWLVAVRAIGRARALILHRDGRMLVGIR